jgi:hypothetical protein
VPPGRPGDGRRGGREVAAGEAGRWPPGTPRRAAGDAATCRRGRLRPYGPVTAVRTEGARHGAGVSPGRPPCAAVRRGTRSRSLRSRRARRPRHGSLQQEGAVGVPGGLHLVRGSELGAARMSALTGHRPRNRRLHGITGLPVLRGPLGRGRRTVGCGRRVLATVRVLRRGPRPARPTAVRPGTGTGPRRRTGTGTARRTGAAARLRRRILRPPHRRDRGLRRHGRGGRGRDRTRGGGR